MNIILPLELNQEMEPGAHFQVADRLNRMTEDEFYDLCQHNAEIKFERRADGTILYMALTGGDTGRRNTKLISRLNYWAEEAALGEVFDSSTGFRLPSGAVRSPDAAWVSNAAWQGLSEEERSKFPPLCPEFVVELLSKSDSVDEMALKMQEYLANGCRLAWLIDPKTQTARIYRTDGTVSIAKSFEETLSGEDILPGFVFSLSTLR